MKIFSPEFLDKVRKFKKLRRSYISFVILVSMFALSLPAELLFNDKPLVMKVDGKWYFPTFCDYTYKDFGGESIIPITDYNSTEFKLVIENRVIRPNPLVIFGDGKEDLSDADLSKETERNRKFISEGRVPWEASTIESLGAPRTIKININAWIPHSYKSTSADPRMSQQTLAGPYANGEWQVAATKCKHWLGTDREGKDVLARIVYGFRISLLFGLSLALTGAVVGTLLGALQGYFGGLVDLLGQRATEIWGSIPQLFLLMILSAFMSKHFFALEDWQHYLLLFGILNLTAWMGIASYMRAEFLRARNLEYVKAAKALGLSNFKIMLRHILPNSLTPIVTFLPFNISGGLLALVSLDFLGFGVKYPAPSLGELLLQGQENLQAWWIIVPTFLVLAITLVLLTFVGEGVRRAFDPRAK